MCCPFFIFRKISQAILYWHTFYCVISNEDVPMVPLTLSPVTTVHLPSVS